MTPLFPARRAAEEFEDVLAGTAGPQVADRHADLLRTAELLRAHEPVQPRPEFAADLRERLLAAAEAELVPAADRERRRVRSLELPHRTGRRRRAGTIAAALVIVGGSAGMAAAASGSLPGEPLYPIKRGVEEIGTALRLGDAAEGRALLGQAGNRLDETTALVASGNPDRDVLVSTIDSFGSTADAGAHKLFVAYQEDGDPADVAAVRTFTTEQMAQLEQLLQGADPALAALLTDAADVLVDLDQQARVLCSTCGPEAVVQPPDSLSEGAAAISMDNLLARPAKQAALDRARAAAEKASDLQALRRSAEEQAAVTPEVTVSLGSDSPATAPRRSPLLSVLLPRGEKTSTSSDKPVKDLLDGVTGTLDGTTGGLKKTTDGLTGDTTEGLTGTVDGLTGGTTEGLTGTVDGLTDQLP